MLKPILLVVFLIGAVAAASIDTFVSNGNNAGRHEFPFKVGLISTTNARLIRCGGSLISRVAVLTAASCIYGSTETTIVLGGSNLANPLEPLQARLPAGPPNYRIHPLYRDGITNSDIAIVRLPLSIAMFTEAINIVQLPSEAMLNEVFANQNALVMGFGQYSNNPASSEILRFIRITTISNTLCSASYFRQIDVSHLCTGITLPRRGICSGDEGAPLVIERDNEFVQIGIASLFPGSGCLSTNPSVFTRVTSFMPWIQQNMN